MGENRGKEILTKMSGNYISHFMSSGLMVLLFLLAVSWLSYSTSDYSFRQDNYQLEIAYILTSLISLGWMMSMIVGISFDLFPLTHNLDSYNQTHSTHYLFINIIGQVLIIAGIFSNNLQLLFEMSTIGMVLLCWGIISIAWPSWKLHRNSVNENINCGNVALIPSVLIPVSCLVILGCWIFRQTTGMLEFGLAFNVIVMMGTISLTLILAHFNRRLSWDVVKFSYFRPVVAMYLGLAILHSFASMWYARGDISQTIYEYTLAAPLLWGFVSTRPLKTIKNAVGSIQKPHSRQFPHDYSYQSTLKALGNLSSAQKFVNLYVNGKSWGVMNVEEHMSKEFLEKQQRKESMMRKTLQDQQSLNFMMELYLKIQFSLQKIQIMIFLD